MYIHLCKNIKCPSDILSLKYSDDEIVKSSLSYNKNSELLENKDYRITRKTSEFIDELKDIYKTKRKKCNYCDKIFSKYKQLENHIFFCIYINNEITTENNKELEFKNIINNKNNIINNTINNYNIDTINNYNININLNIPDKNIISFDKDWNTEHLDINSKLLLFFSNFTNKYTKTLELLLDNDMNKNVLLDDESNTGTVYKNARLEKMKIKDIITNSIDKLQKHLNDFSTEIIKKCEGINDEIIKSVAKDTRFELLNYKNQKDHKIDLTPLIISIFNKYKDDTKNKYIEIQEELSKIIDKT
jgi:hypothetical protein